MAQNSKDTKKRTLQGTAVTSCPCRGVSSRPARPCGPGIVKNVNPHERGRKECPALAPSPFSFSFGRCGRQNHTALHPGNPPFTERNSLARPRPSLGTTRARDCARPAAAVLQSPNAAGWCVLPAPGPALEDRGPGAEFVGFELRLPVAFPGQCQRGLPKLLHLHPCPVEPGRWRRGAFSRPLSTRVRCPSYWCVQVFRAYIQHCVSCNYFPFNLMRIL